MVMRVEPIFSALKKIKRTKRTRVILFEASGKIFTQADSRRYAKNYNHLIFISGRYEGVDARVHKLVDERVTMLDTMKNLKIGIEQVAEKFGKPVADLVDGLGDVPAGVVHEDIDRDTLAIHHRSDVVRVNPLQHKR